MKIDEKKLIEAYNDIVRFPTLQTIAGRFKVSSRTIENHLKRLRSNKKITSIRGNQTSVELIKLPEQKVEFEKTVYVVTSFQNNSLINKPFLESLQTYCKHRKAQLLVIPLRYRNPTSVSENTKYRPTWPSELDKYYITQRKKLNSNVMIMGDVHIQPTATDPLSGLDNLSGKLSAVYAHTSLRMKTVPNHVSRYPKICYTTGALNKPNYSDSKAGAKGEFHHVSGAVIIEIENDKIFHIRAVNADTSGKFYDLNYEYNRDSYRKINSVEYIVYGDLHCERMNEFTKKFTWDAPKSLTKLLNPQKQIWHDAIDFHVADSHHNERDFLLRYFLNKNKIGSVSSSIQRTAAVLNQIAISPEHIFIHSNHHEHLDRWLNRDFRHLGPDDLELYLNLVLAMVKRAKLNKNGYVDGYSVFQAALEPLLNSDKKFIFQSPHKSLQIKDIELNYHGHEGAGRGLTFTLLTKSGTKVIHGHTHSPYIMQGVYGTGTCSEMDMGYNDGPSGWLATHCVTHPNGKRQLISIIPGAEHGYTTYF